MILATVLPNHGNGVFIISAYARANDGGYALLGTRTATFAAAASQQPFGSLDSPAEGSRVSGTIVNFGWALTPQPNVIKTDGSTIGVYVDGMLVGHPVYNNYRADIATALPGYANSNGAVGYFTLDTTKIA